jgi:hypothetical protein
MVKPTADGQGRRLWIVLAAVALVALGVWFFSSQRKDDTAESIFIPGSVPTSPRVTITTVLRTTTTDVPIAATLLGMPCTVGEPPRAAMSMTALSPQVTVTCTAAGWALTSAAGEGCESFSGPYVAADGSPLECVGEYLFAPGQPRTDFFDGTYEVGNGTGQIPAGTYEVHDVEGCYWERLDGNGETIDNNFVNGAPRVAFTVRSTDAGVHVEGCGHWTKVG